MVSRIFKTGWVNFKRNSYVSLGTTGVMVLVLLIFSSLVGINFLTATIVMSLESKVDVTAYFKVDASEEEIQTVRQDLEGLPEVRNIEYISRDQALDEFRTSHAGDPLIQESLAELDINPLQASLNIKANDSAQYAAIVGYLEANQLRTLIDKINYYENEKVINRIRSISGALTNWGFVLTLALAVVASLVTFNTIRLTIYNQKPEIEIMKLVGSSNWHIKGPFLVEGGLYGFFAALVAIAVFYPAVNFVTPRVMALMPEVNLMSYFTANAYQFIPLLIIIGIMLGVISSFIAIRRFLKV